MPQTQNTRPRRRWMAWAVPLALVLGLGALGTGISNASNGADAVNGVNAAVCDALLEQIEAGQEVDASAAIACAEEDFDAVQDERQLARAQGKAIALENGEICDAVNERAELFDPNLALELALACQQRELIVNKVNVDDGIAEEELSSLCQGAQALQARGGQVPQYLVDFCFAELAALAQDDNANRFQDVDENAYLKDDEDYADADTNLELFDYLDAARWAEEYEEADDENANVEVDVDVDIEASGESGNEVKVDVDVDIDAGDNGDDNEDEDDEDEYGNGEDDNDEDVNTEVKVDVEVK